jgi:quinol monooxygenase YgiN
MLNKSTFNAVLILALVIYDFHASDHSSWAGGTTGFSVRRSERSVIVQLREGSSSSVRRVLFNWARMTKKLLTIVAKITAKSGKEDAVRNELMKLVVPTHSEPGCIQYDLHESNSEPGIFLFFENWTSEQDLSRHLQSAHIEALRSKEAELLAMPVEITQWTKIS